jgi:hypothetical protein
MIVAEIEAEVSATDRQFDGLYDTSSQSRPRPVPFFGSLHSARYLTISPNPSADDVGSPAQGCDLAQHCFGYFQRPDVKPHDFFPDWETGLAGVLPDRLSYSINLAHVDLSPRATRSLTAINNSGEDIKCFKENDRTGRQIHVPASCGRVAEPSWPVRIWHGNEEQAVHRQGSCRVRPTVWLRVSLGSFVSSDCQ